MRRPHEISAVRQGGGAKGPAIGGAIEGDEESIRKKKRSREMMREQRVPAGVVGKS